MFLWMKKHFDPLKTGTHSTCVCCISVLEYFELALASSNSARVPSFEVTRQHLKSEFCACGPDSPVQESESQKLIHLTVCRIDV